MIRYYRKVIGKCFAGGAVAYVGVSATIYALGFTPNGK